MKIYEHREYHKYTSNSQGEDEYTYSEETNGKKGAGCNIIWRIINSKHAWIILMSTVVILIVGFSILSRSNIFSYWLFYKPLYSIFGNSGIEYLPFYLDILSFALWIIFWGCVISFAYSKWKPKSRGDKIKKIIFSTFFVGLAVFFIVFFGREYYGDFKEIAQHHVFQTECDINGLLIGGRKVDRYYLMSNDNSVNSNSNGIEMDVYQYKKLKEIKEKMPDAILKVNYLPNTMWLIKYEVETK